MDAADGLAPSHPTDDRDYAPRNQDGNRDRINDYNMGAYERWVIDIVKGSNHFLTPVYFGGDVIYALTIETANMGLDNPETGVTISETLPTGMVLNGTASCSTGSVIQNSAGFSWSGMAAGLRIQFLFTGITRSSCRSCCASHKLIIILTCDVVSQVSTLNIDT